MNWWKAAFLVFVPSMVVVGAYYVLDTATLHNDMQVGYGYTKQDLAAMSELVERRYVGMSKKEFIAHLRSAYSSEHIEDEGSYVLAGQLTFEFDSSGNFERILFPQ